MQSDKKGRSVRHHATSPPPRTAPKRQRQSANRMSRHTTPRHAMQIYMDTKILYTATIRTKLPMRQAPGDVTTRANKSSTQLSYKKMDNIVGCYYSNLDSHCG